MPNGILGKPDVHLDFPAIEMAARIISHCYAQFWLNSSIEILSQKFLVRLASPT